MPAFCSQAESAAADGIRSPRMRGNSRGSSSMPWNRAAFITASRRGWISAPLAPLWRARHSSPHGAHRPGWLRIPAPGSGCPAERLLAQCLHERSLPIYLPDLRPSGRGTRFSVAHIVAASSSGGSVHRPRLSHRSCDAVQTGPCCRKGQTPSVSAGPALSRADASPASTWRIDPVQGSPPGCQTDHALRSPRRP